MIPQERFEQAAKRIQGHVDETPLVHDPGYGLYLKLENRQVTGSFKVRGAFNKVLSLSDEQRRKGLVACSSGNHGQGVALAAGLAGARVIVFASEHASPRKMDAMRSLGAELRLVPGGYDQAEQAALAYVSETQATWISPYNDPEVIAGQGTVGLELDRQLPPGLLETVYVPVGGGGLIAGIALALKACRTGMRVVGVQSEASPFFHELFHAGGQLNSVELPSLADGLSGGVEPGSQTIEIVQQAVDDLVLVSEEETARAVAFAWYRYGEWVEGAAAVALAAAQSEKAAPGARVVILSGGNIQPELHADLIGRCRLDLSGVELL